MSSAVAKEGTILASTVGTEQDFEMLNKQTELNVKKHYEKAETKLQDAVDAAVEDIRQEVEEVLSGNLVQAFVTCLEKSQNASAKNPDSGMDVERIKGQVNFLKNIEKQQVSNLLIWQLEVLLIPPDKVFYALWM
jgi:Fe-S cluster assembly ATPase SufC